jgi:hypothetical protein
MTTTATIEKPCAVREPVSAAVELERIRLRHRANLFGKVMEALRGRAHRLEASGGAPPPAMQHAIRDFRRELNLVRARLAELDRQHARSRGGLRREPSLPDTKDS